MSRSGFLTVDNHELNELCERMAAFADGERTARFIEQALAEVAQNVLKDLIARTPVDTGKLKAQWAKDNRGIAARVVRKGDGYEITLVNTTEYADWVEKGHKSYNQFGGPYTVRNSRIRPNNVPEGHGGGDWVYGRFYVRNTENIWKNGKLDAAFQARLTRWINRTLLGKERKT